MMSGDDRHDGRDDDDYDGDDDDEIIFVSTRQEKWEKLHYGSSSKYGHHRHQQKLKIETIQNAHYVDNNNEEENDGDDDGIILVTTGKHRSSSTTTPQKMNQRNVKPFVMIVAVISVMLIIIARFRNTRKRNSVQLRNRSTEKKKPITKERTTTTKTTSETETNDKDTTIDSHSSTKKSPKTTESGTKRVNPERDNLVASKARKIVHDSSTTTTTTSTPTAQHIVTDKLDVLTANSKELPQQDRPADDVDGDALPELTIEETSRSILLKNPSGEELLQLGLQHQSPPQQLQQQPSNKQTMARQLVKDIRMIQDVLIEHELDPSLAPTIAMNVHTSQHIVESQHKLQYHTTIVNMYQRQLDRQLSERQHNESIGAIKYDPDWRIKLTACTNINNNNNNSTPNLGIEYLLHCVSSIWWNIFWIQHVCRGIIPFIIIQQTIQNHTTSARFDHDDDNNDTNNDWRWILYQLARDLISTMLSEVCGCNNQQQYDHQLSVEPSVIQPGETGYTSSSSYVLSVLGWTKSLLTGSADYYNNYSEWEVSSVILDMARRLVYSTLMPFVEECACFSSCALSVIPLILVAMTVHQGLRVMSAPQSFHHVVNLFSLVAIWGPHRVVKLLVSSMIFLGKGNQLPVGAFYETIADMATLCILIFFPIWEWLATSRLYQQVEKQIDEASAVDFDTTFSKGKSSLHRWMQQVQLIRFVVLTVYSSVILCASIR